MAKYDRKVIQGVEVRGQLYVEQNVTKAYKQYANLREYVCKTKRLTKHEINYFLDKMENPLNNAMNNGKYSD